MRIVPILVLLFFSISANAGPLDSCSKNGRNSLWKLVREYKNYSKSEDIVFKKMSNESPESPLVVAAMLGYDNLVYKMSRNQTEVKKFGAEALYAAASMGRLSTSSLLVEAGVSPNAEIENGLTPIFAAVQYGCRQEISLLVNLGADINHRARVRWTLLRLAVGEGDFETAKLIVDSKYNYSAYEMESIKSYLHGLNMDSEFQYIFSLDSEQKSKHNTR